MKNEALAVKVDNTDISDIARLSIADARQWFVDLGDKLTGQDSEIAARILKEINERLGFLVNVGPATWLCHAIQALCRVVSPSAFVSRRKLGQD